MTGMMKRMVFGNHLRSQTQHTKDHGSVRKSRTPTTRESGRLHGLITQSSKMIRTSMC
ncbi:hypothetical protein Goari_023116 [Gossypium aridum]|uniref:Uncharacterized protein n=1 Tax=Gossypium aridum TaxID=34290 RepID=A0A7J8X204_GOSAI|nr:hypothetical protein [Gossypium aridum]